MIIKILISIFIAFALSRAYLRYRGGFLRIVGFSIWLAIWLGIGIFTWWPKFSDTIATSVGVGRGVDALVYISIVTLFYAVFRIYIKLEFNDRQITSLVRKIAINDKTEKDKYRELDNEKEKVINNQ